MTLEEYICAHSSPENALLEAITHDTHVHILNPHMLSGHIQGRLLSMISHMIRPRRILELGTFTGYSALCLAEGLADDGKMITIEHNDELEETIKRNLSRSPLGDKIELIIGDANEILSAKRSISETVCQAKPILSTSFLLTRTSGSTANISIWYIPWCRLAGLSWQTTRFGTDISSTRATTKTNRRSV